MTSEKMREPNKTKGTLEMFDNVGVEMPSGHNAYSLYLFNYGFKNQVLKTNNTFLVNFIL